MAKRQVSASAQRGPQSSPSHRISTSYSEASDDSAPTLCAEKQTTSTRKAKPREVRRSARLRALAQLEGSSRRKQPETGLSAADEASRDQAQLSTPNKSSLKRKRGQEVPYSSLPAQDPLPSKRSRTSTRHTAEGRLQETEKHTSTTVADPVQSWVLNETWPPEYFEPEYRAREELPEHDSWLEEIMAQPPIPIVQYAEMNGFRYPLPVKKFPTSLRRKQSDSSLTGSSNQKSRDSKSTPYRNSRYKTLLETKGSFLHDFGDDDPPTTVTNPGRDLLDAEQVVPQNSLFRDDIFRRFCREIEDRNEAMVVQDVSRLLVPSAKNLAIYGDRHLDILLENVNEAWTESIPVEGPRPQPDYSVGFRRSAFTDEQLHKLDPLVGSVFDTSFFVATYQMYFPFLTCEVKCGAAALDIADRQNAHSMTIAVRSVIELYRAVKREKELDREILAFSISHDHRSVRIYGHYPVIYEDKITFYRHPIREFSFVEMDGREKWTTYKFTKNIYDIWMPTHLERICSAINQLPLSLDFQVSDEPGVQSEDATGLSQDMGSLIPDPDHVDLVSQEDDELNPIPQTATPDASVSKGMGQWAAKRAKKTRITKEQTDRRKE
ncbi:MAG: hypothetical protein M1836_003745 [Candelina mexicana]|nr:MAG: hypothetical protein M1836_003745 [Candelina mexicana]